MNEDIQTNAASELEKIDDIKDLEMRLITINEEAKDFTDDKELTKQVAEKFIKPAYLLCMRDNRYDNLFIQIQVFLNKFSDDKEELELLADISGIGRDNIDTFMKNSLAGYRRIVFDGKEGPGGDAPTLNGMCLTGSYLTGFFIERYELGELGMGTLIKCAKTWLRYKFKRK